MTDCAGLGTTRGHFATGRPNAQGSLSELCGGQTEIFKAARKEHPEKTTQRDRGLVLLSSWKDRPTSTENGPDA